MNVTAIVKIAGAQYPTTWSDPSGQKLCGDEGCNQVAVPKPSGGYVVTGTPQSAEAPCAPSCNPHPAPPPEECSFNTPEYCHAAGSRTEGPYDVVKEWFAVMTNGLTPSGFCGVMAFKCALYEYFRSGDEMTKQLMATDEFVNLELLIEQRIAAGELGGRQD